jgi:hypothetical protein
LLLSAEVQLVLQQQHLQKLVQAYLLLLLLLS